MTRESPADTTRTMSAPRAGTARRPIDDAAAIPVFAPDEVIAERFRIVRFLGQGGMGQVYEAHDLELGAAVALKIIRPDIARRPREIERFKREVHLARQVTHPNVCRIFELFQHISPIGPWGKTSRPMLFLTMELIPGKTLADLVRRQGPLSIRQALPLIQRMADALDAAHRAGVVHSDFKSSNVLLVETGKDRRVVVTDFGLAVAQAEGGTVVPPRAGQGIAGTPAYMAPEVLAGERITAAADVYSFGVVIHEMLLGSMPGREGDAAGTVLRDLDPVWETAVRRCLERRPERRFRRAGQVAKALTPAKPTPPKAHRVVRPRVGVAAAILLGLAAGFLTFGFAEPLDRLEDLWRDGLIYLAPTHPPRHPLLLIMIDDETLAADPTPLIAMADPMGELLRRALAEGAAGVGIDLLLPSSWSRSASFSDLLVRHSDQVALAAFSPAENDVIGVEAVAGLTAAALGPARTRELFGFVNIDPDDDGVVRRTQARFQGVDGQLWDSFAARAVQILQSRRLEEPETTMTQDFAIDFTLEWPRFDRISWHELEATLESDPERFQDRFLVVGSDYVGNGDGPHRVPHPRALHELSQSGLSRPDEIPGSVLQALIIHTLLDGTPLRRPSGGWILATAVGLATLVAAAVFVERLWWPGLSLASLWSAASYLGFFIDRLMVPVTPVFAAMLLAGLGAAALRRLPGFFKE